MRRIVVGLTTLPSRIQHLDIVLNSIKRQTISVDRIYVFIPAYSQKERVEYPKIIFSPKKFYQKKIQKDTVFLNVEASDIEVKICPKDYGPLTKIYPITQLSKQEMGFNDDDEVLYITVDDDRDYSIHTIASLVKAYDELMSRDAKIPLSIGLCGWIYGSGLSKWTKIYSPEKYTEIDWLETGYGALYNYDLLRLIADKIINVREFPEALITEKLWIAYLLKKIYVGNPHIWCCYLESYNSFNDSLEDIQPPIKALLSKTNNLNKHLDAANRLKEMDTNFLKAIIPVKGKFQVEYHFWNILAWLVIAIIGIAIVTLIISLAIKSVVSKPKRSKI